MTQQQISNIASVLNNDLRCDRYRENAKEIVAIWEDENLHRPHFDDLDKLRINVLEWGGEIDIDYEDKYGGYVITIIKNTTK